MLKAIEIFRKYNGSATKRLGQNYIFSEDLNAKIVEFAGNLKDKHILEIGPGPGGLTTQILKQGPKQLTLIELDRTWATAWLEIAINYPIIHVVNKDVLKSNIPETVDVVISNLPYNIASQILVKLLPHCFRYQKLVLMFQKEMADRISGGVNTKEYGRLSVLAQERTDIKKVLTLGPNCFTPAPKVYSTVLVFTPHKQADVTDFQKLSRLTSIAFENRRKQVIKALSAAYGNNVREIFSQLNIRKDARAEQITVKQYVDLCDMLCD